MLSASLSVCRAHGAFGVARLGAGLALSRGWSNIAIQGWAASGSCSPRAQASFLVTLDTDAEDTELVRRCRAGDEVAFELLFHRHEQWVARLVHRMRGPSSDLEDLVQEVFLQVIRSLRGFRDEARFSTWLY